MDDGSPQAFAAGPGYVLGFLPALTELINRFSKENGSDTPDYVLASYLTHAMLAFDKATHEREKHYGRQVGHGAQVQLAVADLSELSPHDQLLNALAQTVGEARDDPNATGSMVADNGVDRVIAVLRQIGREGVEEILG